MKTEKLDDLLDALIGLKIDCIGKSSHTYGTGTEQYIVYTTTFYCGKKLFEYTGEIWPDKPPTLKDINIMIHNRGRRRKLEKMKIKK